MKSLNLKELNTAEIIGFFKRVDKKIWVATGAGAVIVFLLWVVVIGPAWFERPRLRREIQGMEAQIRQVNALDQKRPMWEENQKAFSEILTGTNDRLFTTEGIGLLLGQISKLADESRVEVLASKPQPEKVLYAAPYNTKYEATGYDFTVQGGYHELGRLVGRIESYGKLLRIRSLQIVPSEKSPERHIAELQVLAITVPSVKATNAKK